jgi:hypothetical protein
VGAVSVFFVGVARGQSFADLALAGNAGGLGNQAQISSLFPERGDTPISPPVSNPPKLKPLPGRSSAPTTISPSGYPAPLRPVYAPDQAKLTSIIWISNKLGVLGFRRPADPPLAGTKRDVTAVQAQLNDFAQQSGIGTLDVLSARAEQEVSNRFVAMQLGALRETQASTGSLAPLAGIYRPDCINMGYGGTSLPPGQTPWGMELFMQITVYFRDNTMFAAMLGTDRFKPYPIRLVSNAPTVREGVVYDAKKVDFFDSYDNKTYSITFFSEYMRFEINGSRFDRKKCPAG